MSVTLVITIILSSIIDFGFGDNLKMENLPTYEIIDMGVLGTDESEAIAINEQGQVLGKLKDGGTWQIFLWDKENGLQILDLPSDSKVCLNNCGHIAGSFSGGVFLWFPETGIFNLGPFNGEIVTLNKLNDNGQIIVTSQSKELQSFHGYNFYKSTVYLWSRENTINLTKAFNAQFPHYSPAIVFNSMNNRGEIVVTSYTPYIPPNKNKVEILLKSFLWKDGKFQEFFSQYIPDRYINVTDMDDEGNMIVQISNHSYEQRFFFSASNEIIELQRKFSHFILRNGSPQIVYCLPSTLKKKADGLFYFSPGAEIKKLMNNTYPYWTNDAWICDQNSQGYAVGNSDTIYPNQRHAFLAVPKFNENIKSEE